MTTPNATREPTGDELRDQGVSDCLSADNAIHRGHRPLVEHALDELITLGLPFTSDDVREYLGPNFQPHSANLLPSVIQNYAATRRIIATGWTRSTRPSRHGGVVRVWIGVQTEDAA